MKNPSLAVGAVLAGAGLLLTTACSVQAPNAAAPAGSAASGTAQSAPPVSGPDSVVKVDESKQLHVAFFGAARANSFAQAAWHGVEGYAKAHNATAEFFDGAFDAQKQVSQMQDAITSGRFDVFVVSANDGTVVIPAVEQALAAGITVVGQFAPIGTRYDTKDPQVPGLITVVDVPTENGKLLGSLGLEACKKAAANPCKVAYLEGFKTLPLDNARTKAVHDTLTAGGAQVVASVEGGYTNEAGRKAMQDVLQSHPDINVVIGSSQAIAGATAVAGSASKIEWVSNGGSRQAVQAVRDGRWFATVCTPEQTSGATATALGLAKARGGAVPQSTAYVQLSPVGLKCTADTASKVEGQYDE
ncbi:sugar ABC transporter substrate-binding protein [Intrasporangium chromatireducens Q5-1]|uniref:Sugar ABC transporter substrate-binding protein n=1 Tax=Intrasporangium chromatireducens Q5-1 TaxID=584657 RepID=W9GLM5_9MICO|nr:sugar ABC transporter substrate-binding protein [Intrasporangium chromatireducens]EWT05738.1 sugar ABC transporter substrate-binding protein [Intrasporangium chromatireducens Q5-1]